MLRSAPDDFGAYYDAARKTRQVWKWEKMEQTAISQCGSNSASFFLYRRAKFIEKDREERMMKEEQEKKRALEAQQVMEANKAEVDKKLKKNQLKRQKKKERKEKFEKKQRGEIVEAPVKKIVRDDSAVKAVSASIQSMKQGVHDLPDLSETTEPVKEATDVVKEAAEPVKETP